MKKNLVLCLCILFPLLWSQSQASRSTNYLNEVIFGCRMVNSMTAPISLKQQVSAKNPSALAKRNTITSHLIWQGFHPQELIQLAPKVSFMNLYGHIHERLNINFLTALKDSLEKLASSHELRPEILNTEDTLLGLRTGHTILHSASTRILKGNPKALLYKYSQPTLIFVLLPYFEGIERLQSLESMVRKLQMPPSIVFMSVNIYEQIELLGIDTAHERSSISFIQPKVVGYESSRKVIDTAYSRSGVNVPGTEVLLPKFLTQKILTEESSKKETIRSLPTFEYNWQKNNSMSNSNRVSNTAFVKSEDPNFHGSIVADFRGGKPAWVIQRSTSSGSFILESYPRLTDGNPIDDID